MRQLYGLVNTALRYGTFGFNRREFSQLTKLNDTE